jgi:hypothetical protein
MAWCSIHSAEQEQRHSSHFNSIIEPSAWRSILRRRFVIVPLQNWLISVKGRPRVAVVPEATVPPIREDELQVIKRPVGRPRKIVVQRTVEAVLTPSNQPPAIISPTVYAAGRIVRRPVGRPRKVVVVTPSPTLVTPPKKAPVPGRPVIGKTDKPKQKISNRSADDQEPVQWWVEGWKGQ